jgi:hypothetical protein
VALLSGGIAVSAMAAAVGPGPGGGGGAAAGNGAHSRALGHRSVGCTTVSFGKIVATGFVAQNGIAPNGQPCSNSDSGE